MIFISTTLTRVASLRQTEGDASEIVTMPTLLSDTQRFCVAITRYSTAQHSTWVGMGHIGASCVPFCNVDPDAHPPETPLIMRFCCSLEVLMVLMDERRAVISPDLELFSLCCCRAQALLVVVGHPVLLLEANTWRNVITHCAARGAYKGAGAEELAAQLGRGHVPEFKDGEVMISVSDGPPMLVVAAVVIERNLVELQWCLCGCACMRWLWLDLLWKFSSG